MSHLCRNWEQMIGQQKEVAAKKKWQESIVKRASEANAWFLRKDCFCLFFKVKGGNDAAGLHLICFSYMERMPLHQGSESESQFKGSSRLDEERKRETGGGVRMSVVISLLLFCPCLSLFDLSQGQR